MNDRLLSEMADFVLSQLKKHKFGEISLNIKIRDGKAVYLHRSFSDGLKLDENPKG